MFRCCDDLRDARVIIYIFIRAIRSRHPRSEIILHTTFFDHLYPQTTDSSRVDRVQKDPGRHHEKGAGISVSILLCWKVDLCPPTLGAKPLLLGFFARN